MKVRNNYDILKPFFFFFALARKKITTKTHCIKSRFVIAPETTVSGARHVRTLLSPETLQAGTVKGLKGSPNEFAVQISGAV